MPEVKEVATEETYRSVEKLICDLCWRFCRQTGADFDETVAEANLTFVEACRSHVPGRSKLSTWVHFKVQKKLQTLKRDEARRRDRLPTTNEVDPDLLSRPERFDLERLMMGLSDDAVTIIRLLLETPVDLISLITLHRGRRIRRDLFRHLRAKQWTVARIVESYNEIGEALE